MVEIVASSRVTGIRVRRTQRREILRHRRSQRLRRLLFFVCLLGLLAVAAQQIYRVTPFGQQQPAPDIAASPISAIDIPIPAVVLPTNLLVYPSLAVGEHLRALETQMQALSQQRGLRSGAFFIELNSKRHVDLKGDEPFSAASVIKLPILVEFFRQVDSGRIQLDEVLTLRQDHKGGGSGWLQYRPNGTRMSALGIATLMIVRSDNTATNMIIDRVGGQAYLNTQFERWGLTRTVLRDWLPDLPGQNTTSPRDMVLLLSELEQGHLLTNEARDLAYDILYRTRVKTLLPRGLDPGTRIAHKTGDIGKAVGDAGLIILPDGRRYLAAILVERPHNDRRANQLIGNLSRLFYKEFKASGAGQVQTLPR